MVSTSQAAPDETPDTTPAPAPRQRRPVAGLVLLATFAGGVLTFATLARSLATRWWFADLLTQFTVQYVILLVPAIAVMIWFRRWRWALVMMLALIVNGWQVAAYYGPVPLPGRLTGNAWQLRIMTQNVLRTNQQFENFLRVANQFDPDIIALQEIDESWMAGLSPLQDAYPHVRFEDYPGNFGIGLFSKFPWDSIDVQLNGPLQLPSIHARFSQPGGQVIELVNTHPLPPEGQADTQYRNEQLLLTAHELDPARSRIVMGDFNLTPWSPWFHEILRRGELVDAARGWGVAPTWYFFPSWLGGVKIDHVLVSPEIGVDNYRVGPAVGSDHRAVIVDIRIPGSE